MGIFRFVYVLGRVATGAGINIVKGVGSTAYDACRLADRLVKRDIDGSLSILGNRVERTITGVGYGVNSALELLDDFDKSKGSFLREKNIQRMTAVASLGMAATAGVQLFGVDADGGVSTDSLDSDLGTLAAGNDVPTDIELANQIGLPADAIQNGTFVGDADDLSVLTHAGEIHSSDHIDAQEVNRDISVRNDFLAGHGFTSVPEGYEVHHIVPLSEGGSDSSNNMVLIDEEQHDQITAEHRQFYGWNTKT